MRKVILHYHLFKNAGTSLDAAFKENFSAEAGEWVTKEFPANPTQNQRQLRQWILDNPQAKCFSSHTALLPVPEFDDIKVFPVIFVRHPIDRIASAYSFEKKQGADTFGSVLARNTSLKGYIETRLSLVQDRQCRNFHCERFAVEKLNSSKYLLEDSLLTAKTLPFIGIVENFEQSIMRLEKLLHDFGFSSITLIAKEANVSREIISIDEKLSSLESELGQNIWNTLIEANKEDLALYEKLSTHYD